MAPATSPAQVTIDGYKITPVLQGANSVGLDGPSSFQAGANPDAGSWSRFTYPNATEDVQIARTNFAAGLLGNPESVPKCPEAALQTNTCPVDHARSGRRVWTRSSPARRSTPGGSFSAPSTTRSRSPTSPAAWAS